MTSEVYLELWPTALGIVLAAGGYIAGLVLIARYEARVRDRVRQLSQTPASTPASTTPTPRKGDDR
jgi:hypothetical protein